MEDDKKVKTHNQKIIAPAVITPLSEKCSYGIGRSLGTFEFTGGLSLDTFPLAAETLSSQPLKSLAQAADRKLSSCDVLGIPKITLR